MLSFPDPPKERSGLAIIAQIGTAFVSAIGVLVLACTSLYASAYSSRQAAFRTSLSQVGQWVDQSGKITVLRGNIAEILGFQGVDLRVHERGFRITGEQLTHVCSTTDLPGFEEIIFLALVDENTGDAVIWRGTRNGDLVMTARFVDGSPKTVPNDTGQVSFDAEKEFFLKKMRAETFRSNPTPSDTLQALPGPLESAVDPKVKTPSRHVGLAPEITTVLLYPWVIPVVIAALVMGASSRSKRWQSKHD